MIEFSDIEGESAYFGGLAPRPCQRAAAGLGAAGFGVQS